MQAASVGLMIFRVSDSVCVGERVAPRDSTSVPVRPPMHSSRARTHRPMPFQIQLRDEVAAISLMDSQTATNGDVVNWR